MTRIRFVIPQLIRFPVQRDMRYAQGFRPGWSKMSHRRGLATLDYILVLCVCLPMVAFTLWAGPRIMNLVYQMLCVLVSWPFM